jgi:hypothetical protein
MTRRYNTCGATVIRGPQVLDTHPDKAAYNRVAKYSTPFPIP